MTNYPKPVMRDYQKEYIYNPIMDVMADRISTHRKSKSLLKFLALSTSSGKTFTAFGCMRKDLSLMKEDNIKLSCNTNLKTPVERDKHTLINFIILKSNGTIALTTHR